MDIKQVTETIAMIEEQNFDVRTITMGISLLDCIDSDIDKAAEKVYNKIVSKAKNLVAVGDEIAAELGIPIVNKRVSVTPISIIGAATDATDYLVNHGVPFRDAHGIVGRLVLTCIDKGISLDELPLEDYKAISPVFENDIYEAISMRTCVEKRMTIGAPGPDVMEKVIAENKKYLEEN